MKQTTRKRGVGSRLAAAVLSAALAVGVFPAAALAEEPLQTQAATAETAAEPAAATVSETAEAPETTLQSSPEVTEEAAETAQQEDTASDEGWQFTYFGTSTSAAANSIADGSSISDTVTLNSCTVKDDGTINKKGGKFVADSPADGLSFYYTTIDPSTQNFFLQADVTIDYINPSPDGQEGFALMVRDTISGSGSYFSNQASVTGTKLPSDGLNGSTEVKDMVGVRDYTGIISNETAESNNVVAYRMGFDENGTQIAQGDTYRVSLEKTAYGYISRQYAINDDGSTGDVLGEYTLYIPAKDTEATAVSSYAELDDPMSVQESGAAYVGLAVARGLNATFSNITYTTSEWKAEDWTVQPTTYVDPDYRITSPSTCAEDTYTLVFKANADGKADIYSGDTLVQQAAAITADTEYTLECPISGDTTFKVVFTPDGDFSFSAYEKLSSYETATITKTVSHKTLGADGKIYTAPDGTASNGGTSASDAVDLQTALNYAQAGQTILLESETYVIDRALTVERGRDGTAEAPITMTTADGGFATIDFDRTGTGFTLWGSYWNVSRINITGTADGSKGMQLSGSHCVLERMNFYNNGNSGLQVSGSSAESKDKWPSYNTIKNCTSMNNADRAMEDADGFAAKLTAGEGNVFDGCIAAYNADDGWDLFAKASTGSIGAVTIQNCVTYKNGYLMLKSEAVKKQPFDFPTVTCDEDGNLSFSDVNYTIEAGNGNGFKMGGTNLPGGHQLINSISYENAAKGIDSNSCTDIKVTNSTSFNNEGYNIAMYTGNKSATTAYAASGVLSFRTSNTGIKEQIALQSQSSTDVYGETNFYWDADTATSHNTASNETTVEESWFESLDTSVQPTRNADGSINMHGLLLLTAEGLAAEAGARGAAWGQTEAAKATIWVVGDSTVSPFNDSYYLPRVGYGEELDRYLNADVYNLAVSGASSKDFTTMKNYTTLISGSDDVPAMGSADGDQFLIIGFGHNDEKTEAARFTDPNGDYQTEGSFANSLYVNYIKPALDAGVTPIVCTPIARLSNANTEESYRGTDGHITTESIVGDTTYPGGDYPQAIRDMCETLGLTCIDLTKATITENVALGDDAQWLHAFTGAKLNDDGTLTPTGLDQTHTNQYGAKLHAWYVAELAAEQNTTLGSYSKNKSKPTYEADFADAVNPDYVPKQYKAPTTTSTIWPEYTAADGRVWHGSVFGDVGGADNIKSVENGGKFSAAVGEDGSMTLSVSGNKGKIASTSDGLMFYYIQLPAGTKFTLTANATINDPNPNVKQVAFGLMARDDLYIDEYVSETMGDYVSAGPYTANSINYNCFGRKNGAIYNPLEAETVYNTGDTVALSLTGTSDGFTLKYGDNPTASAGFDYALTAVDPDYIYVGFYVARNANITFSDVTLTLNDTSESPDPEVTPSSVPAVTLKPAHSSIFDWFKNWFRPGTKPEPEPEPEPPATPSATPATPLKPSIPNSWHWFWPTQWA